MEWNDSNDPTHISSALLSLKLHDACPMPLPSTAIMSLSGCRIRDTSMLIAAMVPSIDS